MVLIELRPFILALLIAGGLYVFYRLAYRIIKSERIVDRKEEIKETLREAKSVPDISDKDISKAEKKVKDFIGG